MLEEQKMEAVSSEPRECCHPTEAGITATCPAGAAVVQPQAVQGLCSHYTDRTEEYPGYSLLLPFTFPPLLPKAQTQRKIVMYEPEKSSLLGSASLRHKAELRKGEE